MANVDAGGGGGGAGGPAGANKGEKADRGEVTSRGKDAGQETKYGAKGTESSLGKGDKNREMAARETGSRETHSGRESSRSEARKGEKAAKGTIKAERNARAKSSDYGRSSNEPLKSLEQRAVSTRTRDSLTGSSRSTSPESKSRQSTALQDRNLASQPQQSKEAQIRSNLSRVKEAAAIHRKGDWSNLEKAKLARELKVPPSDLKARTFQTRDGKTVTRVETDYDNKHTEYLVVKEKGKPEIGRAREYDFNIDSKSFHVVDAHVLRDVGPRQTDVEEYFPPETRSKGGLGTESGKRADKRPRDSSAPAVSRRNPLPPAEPKQRQPRPEKKAQHEFGAREFKDRPEKKSSSRSFDKLYSHKTSDPRPTYSRQDMIPRAEKVGSQGRSYEQRNPFGDPSLDPLELDPPIESPLFAPDDFIGLISSAGKIIFKSGIAVLRKGIGAGVFLGVVRVNRLTRGPVTNALRQLGLFARPGNEGVLEITVSGTGAAEARRVFNQLRGANPIQTRVSKSTDRFIFTAKSATGRGTVTFRASSVHEPRPVTVDVHGIQEGIGSIKFLPK